MGVRQQSTPPALDPVVVPHVHAHSGWMWRRRRRRRATVPRVGAGWAGAGRLCAWALGIACACVGVGHTWRWLAEGPWLVVRRIDVHGEHRTTRPEVLAYAGAQLGAPILGLDLDAMALRLRHHPWIGRATLRRQLPDRLHIDVVEHEPALLVSLGELYLADAQGQLFKRFEAQDHVALPVVTGMDREGAIQHGELMAQRLRTALQLMREAAVQRDVLGRVEEVHFDEDLGWHVMLQPDAGAVGEVQPPHGTALTHNVRAQLGHAPLAHLPRLARTLAALAERGRQPEVVWADGERTGERVPVELLAERGAAAAPAARGNP